MRRQRDSCACPQALWRHGRAGGRPTRRQCDGTGDARYTRRAIFSDGASRSEQSKYGPGLVMAITDREGAATINKNLVRDNLGAWPKAWYEELSSK